MSYGKYLVGLGLALVVLATLGAGVTLGAQWLNYAGKAAAMGWGWGQASGMMGGVNGMMGMHHCPCMGYMNDEHNEQSIPMKQEVQVRNEKFKGFSNVVEITGKVINKIDERHVIVVQGDDGKTYNVTIRGVYIRTIDGTLVYGGWLYHDGINVGDSVTIVGVGNKTLKALSIHVDGETFQNPMYYEFVKHRGG